MVKMLGCHRYCRYCASYVGSKASDPMHDTLCLAMRGDEKVIRGEERYLITGGREGAFCSK